MVVLPGWMHLIDASVSVPYAKLYCPYPKYIMCAALQPVEGWL